MNDKTRDFIEKNLDVDVRQLALKGCRDKDIDLTEALRQIAGRQTARRKLPSWAAIDGILYPPHLNMEQCSSEQTARYKAVFCRRLLTVLDDAESSRPQKTSLLDLTGGFGVDFVFMSEAFDEATYVERDAQLFSISSANFETLGIKVQRMNADGIEVLHQTEHATVIFLDPARRDDHGARTYGISDCTPNVLEIEDELLEKSDYLIIKLSPMLDWRKAVIDLGERFVREVHIVAVNNECKELLVVLSRIGEGLSLFCVNDQLTFLLSGDPVNSGDSVNSVSSDYTGLFLYEPNAAIMKAGCFQQVAKRYGIIPLAPNSHLFVSETLVTDFPGRIFQIQAISSMNKRELKASLGDIRQANITTRNFPLSVAELRKRLHLTDGGSTYIFATTLASGAHVLLIAHAPSVSHADCHRAE